MGLVPKESHCVIYRMEVLRILASKSQKARPILNGTDVMYCQLLFNDVGLFLYIVRVSKVALFWGLAEMG